MNRGKLLSITIVLVVVFISFREDLFQVSKNLDIFAALYKEININYVDETNPASMMRIGIDAMLKSLDPYTDYVPESEIENYKLKFISAQYGGIGAGTLFIDGKLYVSDVLENKPAHQQDVRPGDEIIKINGIETQGKDKNQISQLIRGPKGSSIDLTLMREATVLNKSLIRQEIKQANVTYSGMLADGFGYIKLDKFLENAAQEVKDALDSLNKENLKGLVFDLRDNGGGILGEAIKIVNFFIPQNELVLTQKGRNSEKNFFHHTLADPILPNLPLVILVNKNSASASEIVAGSLQDLDRAVIVGQRSFGKGLVQQTFHLPYNSLVKVTIAKYFTPSGRCIQSLDYAHRNKNGTVSKFADSLSKPFNTKTGRTVFSDNGVYPDVLIPEEVVNSVTLALANKNLFFHFANVYKKLHKAIPAASSFKLNDDQYDQFIAFIATKKFNYTLQIERLFTEFQQQAEKENKSEAVKEELERLKTKIAAAKKVDLISYKNQIKRFLESQIINRYYFDKGKIEQAFQYDNVLIKAKALLGNQTQMTAILKGEGSYKIIGKPDKETVSVN